MQEYGISARLTFSNSLLRQEHLSDRKCNALCRLFERNREPRNGVIIYSELLLEYIKEQYPGLYFVSSTTKVLTDFTQLEEEIRRKDFHYVVPDFRLNKAFDKLNTLSQAEKDKVEFLCNECCWAGCRDRKACYETVSRKNLGENCLEHYCKAPEGERGYLFSKAIENPGFIGINDIRDIYLPMGFSNFKIEGRGLGSALILEFLLYYMTRAGIPDTCQRKNLSGQYAGSVLRDLYHRIVLLYDNAVVFLSEKVCRYQNSVAVAVKLSKLFRKQLT